MKTTLLAAAALVISVIPSFAADYYIVREGDGPCRIVESRPTDTKTVIVGGDKMYTTREEADTQMKTVCKEN